MPIRKYLSKKDDNGFTLDSAKKHFPPSLTLEPFHQTIRLRFNLEKKLASGEIQTTVKANKFGATRISLDAVNLEIITVQGPEKWDYDGTRVNCSWNTPFNKGEERIFTIKYNVKEPITGMYFNYPDQEYPNRIPYCITDTESERARYWLPCIDHLSVRCSIDFYLTGSQKHFLIANGKKMNESLNEDGTKTVHWHQAFPCPSYLITLAVGDFIEVQDDPVDMGNGPIPVAYYTTSNFTIADLKRSFKDTPKFLRWMAEKWQVSLGWDKYYQIATSLHAGAMENISFVTWNDFAIVNEKEAPEMQWLVDIVNVHEMSHSWFGDMIVCKEFAHAWLKESWATYIESIYMEDQWGKNDALYHLYCDAQNYMQEADSNYKRPIVSHLYDHSWTMYDYHLYPGGGWRLHMLRNLIGDEAFFAAARDYLQSYRGKVVETVDFRRKCEKHSGMNLEFFFDQWFYTKGYPNLKAELEYDADHKLGSIKVTQKQVDEKQDVPIFHFPLKIQWQSEDKQWHNQVFEITNQVQTCYFSATSKPLQIYLDPEYVLLCKLEFNPGLEILKRHVQGENIIVKIRAADELAKIGSNTAISALYQAYEHTKFWGVKVRIAKALAKIPHNIVPQTMVDILEHETDPMVLSDLLSSMINLRDDRIFKGIKTFLNRDQLPYWAHREALQVIGSQRTQESTEFLLNYPLPEDYKGIITSGYYRALGRTRNPKVWELLATKIRYGQIPEEARRATVQGFVDSIVWMETSQRKRYLEKLADLLKTEQNESLVLTTIRLSKTLDDPTLIGPIQNVRSKVSLQNQNTIDKIIKSLESSTEPSKTVEKFEKKIESLTSKISKLVDRIEKLENQIKSKE